MTWSKIKQQLESFLSPALQGKVEYRATGYRYLPDKAGICYMAVDKKNILNMNDATTLIRWYTSEQEIKNDAGIEIPISQEQLAAVRTSMGDKIPKERLIVIARSQALSELAKELMAAQAALSKSDFITVATRFLSSPIEQSLESKEMLLNILALVDRRVGKKRIVHMSETIQLKHPAVQYFIKIRLGLF
ncbi:hypothetical protein B5M42_016130 [Paenibacillus athensensis]|uniref:Uncharacterized protein n=1 Tax=Paenibacillus athensensis TaxID=1967502 RepID=A0A4Y8Q875_9BACL|nr:hypothetical protein [Paenibacillus athensensis]MCD1260341.1 hypothetical protein [Paenibacillus athensensis]